jgi:hypothetical protein
MKILAGASRALFTNKISIITLRVDTNLINLSILDTERSFGFLDGL